MLIYNQTSTKQQARREANMYLKIVSLGWMAEKPIPDLSLVRQDRETYTIRIKDQGERLVEVRDHGLKGDNHFWVMKNPPVSLAIPHLLVRESLVHLLGQANQFLMENEDWKLFIKDGWRPVALQEDRYQYNRGKLQQEHPDWSPEEVDKRMQGWFTRVMGGDALRTAPPPHCTGAAVDVVLQDHRDGQLIPMGGGPGRNWPDLYEQEEEKRDLSLEEKEFQRNRRILFWTMVLSGFAPNPTEWWHYSWGDQMWAGWYKAPAAIYGLVETINGD